MKRQFFQRRAGEIGGPWPHGARRANRRGVSLVLVLAFLVIITGLVLAFFASVTNELSSAQSDKGEIVARQLAQSAVQSVMGTISQATMTAAAATPTTWSSQPGMIWNFDTSGNATTAYKLYSSDNAVVSPAQGFDSSSDVPKASVWNAQPALYTDLNAPVTKTVPGTTTATQVFPILDGNNMGQTTADGQTTPVLTYKASASDPNQGVAGFSLDPTSTVLTNTSGANPSSTNNPVPMPVKWVYVLKDGSMTTPTGVDSTGKIANWTGAGVAPFAGVKPPTANNPIVGRVAFWTDDETCKVNVNTASQGTAWDTPRGQSSTEVSYATYQPAQHEWQRYPGHPATVSLSTIFPGLTANSIYGITPRVAAGGSYGGTQTPTGPITPDADRLYASLDELLFSPTRTVNASMTQSLLEQKKFFLTARSVAPEVNLFDLPRIACWPIASLTGTSTSTSYDTARTTAFDRLIGTCSTIGTLGGTFYPYYFQRQNYLSPTTDISIPRNLQLYSYLQNLTSAVPPGYTTSFASKYGNACRDQILTEIFDYIRSTNLSDDNLAAQTNPPGVTYTPYVSGSTTSVPGHGFVVPTVYTNPQGTVTQGFGRAYTLAEFGLGFICNADGSDPAPTSPTDATTSNNPGTNSVLGGTALHPITISGTTYNTKYIQAIVILSFFSPSNGWTSLQPDMQVQITGLDKMTVTDASGAVHQLFRTESSSDSPNLNTTLYGFSQNAGSYGSNPGWRYTLNLKTAPARGNYAADAATPSYPHTYNYSSAPAINNIPPYPFIGIPVIMNVKSSTSDTMTFSGDSNIQVSFYAGTFNTTTGTTITPSASNLIQTININMPAATFPVPNLVRIGTTGASGSSPNPVTTTMQNWWSYTRSPAVTFTPTSPAVSNGRLYFAYEQPYIGSAVGAGAFFLNSASAPPASPFLNTDVVRTVCPADSDFRLVAGLHNVPSTVFVPHANYNNQSMYIASGLTTAGLPWMEQVNNDAPYPTAASVYYPTSTGVSVNYFYPDAPSTMTSSLGSYTPLTPYSQNTWDCDSAIPDCFDGPYINKPDEGNLDYASSGVPYYSNWSVQTAAGATYFTPNRIMTSPGMFGSLPTGIVPPVGTGSVGTLTPWQTLLFRPQPIHPQSSTVPPFDAVNGVNPSRPGTAPDHLLLDLFWMPVVEPYAISDTFSTAGKINMNYQISPFKYITRTTALRALFQNETVASILNTNFSNFKSKSTTAPNIRQSIDPYQTLTQFNQYFNTNGLFRSAAQICDLFIVPADPSLNSLTPSAMDAYWLKHIATGDNLRERVYTNLYPRLTTKSNTYTVHFRAQALKQSPTSQANGIWNEGLDPVQAEYRGSSVIERYIDPSDPALTATDFASETIPATTSLSQFYRWRIVETHRFTP